MSNPDPEPNSPSVELIWKEDYDFHWTTKAFGMIESGELSAEMQPDGQRYTALVNGPCPRCGDPLDVSEPMSGLFQQSGFRVDVDAPPHFNVDIRCGCLLTHTGAPAKTTGCGVVFRIEFEN